MDASGGCGEEGGGGEDRPGGGGAGHTRESIRSCGSSRCGGRIGRPGLRRGRRRWW